MLLIAAAAIAGPVWAVFFYKPPPVSLAGTIPDPRTLARFDAMAEAACRCRRADLSDGGKDTCWDAFNKIVLDYDAGYEVQACGVTGTASVCFGNKCVIVDHSPRGECNAEERRIIEAIWSGYWDRYSDDPAVLEADRRAHEAFERGDRLKAPPPGTAGGCGS
ncbi:MAG: hypothetical protein ACAH11_13750 [Sphingomonas sp.]|nr:hypothetical protein [Sphingomonas sp.]